MRYQCLQWLTAMFTSNKVTDLNYQGILLFRALLKQKCAPYDG